MMFAEINKPVLIKNNAFYVGTKKDSSKKYTHNITKQSDKYILKKIKFSEQVIIDCSKNQKILEYHHCIFEKEIQIENVFGDQVIAFYNCEITKELIFEDKYGNKNSLDDTKLILCFEKESYLDELKSECNEVSEKICQLTFKNFTYWGKLHIFSYIREDKIPIDKLVIYESCFKNNFKLFKAKVQGTYIRDVDFEGNMNFSSVEFINGLKKNENEFIYDGEQIIFEAINCKGLAIFEECEFDNCLALNYVTFYEISHFRYAKFNKGLDLERTNIQKNINFFDIQGLDQEASKQNTSQETYRIIKYNFQQVGNKIEANKYQALELERFHHSLNNPQEPSDKHGDWQTNVMLTLQKWASDYSRDWVLVLLWIIFIGAFTTFFMCVFNLDSSNPVTNIFKYAWLPYNYNLELDGSTGGNHPVTYYIILVLNKLFLAYLYYQFVAVIRSPKRNPKKENSKDKNKTQE